MTDTTSTDITETEDELIANAQQAVSSCNWVVGECAAKWTKKYARGRTDADFAQLVGLSPDQAYQRRRVWETFGDVCGSYKSLKWSHFYTALNWDDAPECLVWAEENEAAVAEMRAWRRALHGEDLTEEAPPEDWGESQMISFVPNEATPVRAPSQQGESATAGSREASLSVAGVAREGELPGGNYAPFRSGAGSPPPKESSSEVAVAAKPQVSADELIKRMAGSVERLNKALTPEMVREFKSMPAKSRKRFVNAVAELSSKVAGLM